MTKDTSGPAFPAQFYDERATGMTLRDYFAAKAMQAYCSHSKSCDWMPHEIAEDAYLMADAMLKAMEQ